MLERLDLSKEPTKVHQLRINLMVMSQLASLASRDTSALKRQLWFQMCVLLPPTARQELCSLSTASLEITALERVVLWLNAHKVITAQADLIPTWSVPTALIVKLAAHNPHPVLMVRTVPVLWIIFLKLQDANLADEVCTQQKSSLTFVLTALLATLATAGPIAGSPQSKP